MAPVNRNEKLGREGKRDGTSPRVSFIKGKVFRNQELMASEGLSVCVKETKTGASVTLEDKQGNVLVVDVEKNKAARAVLKDTILLLEGGQCNVKIENIGPEDPTVEPPLSVFTESTRSSKDGASIREDDMSAELEAFFSSGADADTTSEEERAYRIPTFVPLQDADCDCDEDKDAGAVDADMGADMDADFDADMDGNSDLYPELARVGNAQMADSGDVTWTLDCINYGAWEIGFGRENATLTIIPDIGRFGVPPTIEASNCAVEIERAEVLGDAIKLNVVVKSE